MECRSETPGVCIAVPRPPMKRQAHIGDVAHRARKADCSMQGGGLCGRRLAHGTSADRAVGPGVHAGDDVRCRSTGRPVAGGGATGQRSRHDQTVRRGPVRNEQSSQGSLRLPFGLRWTDRAHRTPNCISRGRSGRVTSQVNARRQAPVTYDRRCRLDALSSALTAIHLLARI